MTPMVCDYCNVEMTKRISSEKEPYHYQLSGLRDVLLFGITVQCCPSCGFEAPIIPRIQELHDVIARAVLNKAGTLRGEEIRFLRKYAGFPANAFAHLLGITPQYLSRVENGHVSRLGTPTDRLVRALTIRAKGTNGKDVRDALIRHADLVKQQEKERRRWRSQFRLQGKRWKPAA